MAKKIETKNMFTASDFTVMAVSGASATNVFSGVAGQTRVALSWTLPTDVTNLSGVRVNYDTTAVPADQTAGTLLYFGTGTSTEQTGLSANVPYYYGLFTQDKTGDWSVLTANTSASLTPFANNTYQADLHPYLTNDQVRALFIDEGII